MRKAFIIYTNFFDRKGEKLTVGGIQSYIQALCPIVRECGYTPIIFQIGNRSFVNEWEGITVYGFAISNHKNPRKYMLERCYEMGDINTDLVIFGSDVFAIKSNFKRTISIQHGVTWDIPSRNKNIKLIKDIVNRIKVKAAAIIKVHNAHKVVCVDYNFVNWYRTVAMSNCDKLEVIPNFSRLYTGVTKHCEDKVRIIFARRFFWYRGTRIFSEVAKKILQNYNNIEITIAGEGPDEEYLKNQFANNPNVRVTKFDSCDSLSFHANHDIAVVPTIGSEGTSLSLLEAMSAGCATIATNVGGMTNIIIDGYNGLLVNPDFDSLYEGIIKLIENCSLREEIQHNAVITVEKGFSYEIWKAKWKKVLSRI